MLSNNCQHFENRKINNGLIILSSKSNILSRKIYLHTINPSHPKAFPSVSSIFPFYINHSKKVVKISVILFCYSSFIHFSPQSPFPLLSNLFPAPPGPISPQRTRLLPCLLPRTSARRPFLRTSSRTCGPCAKIPQRVMLNLISLSMRAWSLPNRRRGRLLAVGS